MNGNHAQRHLKLPRDALAQVTAVPVSLSRAMYLPGPARQAQQVAGISPSPPQIAAGRRRAASARPSSSARTRQCSGTSCTRACCGTWSAAPAIMREQLDKLAELAREPGMVIQILPFTASDHPGTDGPILVYDFDGASSVAYTECNGGGRIVESADEVGDLMAGSSRAPPAASGTIARLPKKGLDVTTPNVARTYDYVCHERGGSPAAGLSD